MSPAIRDGRGVLTEHRMDLEGHPPGPVIRVTEPSVVRRIEEVASKRTAEQRERMRQAQLARYAAKRGEPANGHAADVPDSIPAPDDEPRAVCAHISGIEHVQVTQPEGSKYEWWRCLMCRTEFRPTGEPAAGEAPIAPAR